MATHTPAHSNRWQRDPGERRNARATGDPVRRRVSWAREDLEERPDQVSFSSDVAATRGQVTHLVWIMVAIGSLLALTAATMALLGGSRVSMLGVVAGVGIVMLAHPLVWRNLLRGERCGPFDDELAPARPGDDATV